MIRIVNEEEAKFLTHNGPFHADDVFATVMLEKLYGDVALARVAEVKEDSDAFAYDIGFGKYDHHQEDKAIRDNGIHYSSLGLIWRDFGHEILQKSGLDQEDLYLDIDETFILPIDALDNGEGKRIPATITSVIAMSNPFWNSKITPDEAFLNACNLARTLFDVYVTGLLKDGSDTPIDYDEGYNFIDNYLYQSVLEKAEAADCFIYNEEGSAIDLWEEYGEDIMKAYGTMPSKAAGAAHNVAKMFINPLSYEREEYEEITGTPIEILAIMGEDQEKGLGKKILDYVFETCMDSEKSRMESIDYIEERIDLSTDHIIVLESFAPWKGTLLASDSPKAAQADVVVFPSSRGGWNFQGIPVSSDAFEVRCKVPAEWLGKRDEELQEVCGISDAMFVHPGGFIGGAKSFEGAMALARAIVKNTEK